MNRKSSLLENLGVEVGIYCARRLIKCLDIFAKQLWKATVSFFMSVCLPVCLSLWNISARKGWIFIKFYVGVLLLCCGWTLQHHRRTKKKHPKNENKDSWTQKHNINKPNVKYNMKLGRFY